MKKINFEDGELVTPAKVIIDGTEHEVTEAEYSGTTPLSAHNLNKLQDNIEEALDEADGVPTNGIIKFDGEEADIPEGYEVVNNDTGWINMSQYISNQNFTARPGMPPQVRRIGNIVYWRGQIYCNTNLSSNMAQLLANIPNKYLPTAEHGIGGVTYHNAIPFQMFISDNGEIWISQTNNIMATENILRLFFK